MAPPIRQWPVCRNRWAGLVRAWSGRAASAGHGVLSLEPDGRWQWVQPAQTHRLRLVHAWPSPAWMALRFQAECGSGPNAPLELTLWKSGLSDDAWRALRLCVEGRIAKERS